MGGHVDYRYDWTEEEESSITGPDLIRDTSEKVSLIRGFYCSRNSDHKIIFVKICVWSSDLSGIARVELLAHVS